MSVKVLSAIEVASKLNELRNRLSNLPDNLPTSKYYFTGFDLVTEDVEEYGRDGAVNRALEVILAPFGRQNGILLEGRGPGLVAVVEVLRRFIEEFPENVMLQKWVFDLIEAADKAGGKNIVPIDPALTEQDQEAEVKKRKTNKSHGKQKKQRKLIVPACDTIMNRYIDVDEAELAEIEENKGKGGPVPDPLLKRVRVMCRLRNDPTGILYYRCIGAATGCEQNQKVDSSWRMRSFTHASECSHLDRKLRDEVLDAMADTPSRHNRKKFPKRGDNKSSSSEESDSELDSDTPASLSRTSTLTESTGSFSHTSTLKSIQESGSVFKWSRDAGIKNLTKQVNDAVLKLICVRGLPPSIIDSPEWRTLLATAAPQYQQTGSKTFIDFLIPQESAIIKRQQREYLKKCKNLTISFDGGTTMALQSVYTIHIITPDRRIFLFEGDESSGTSHTGEHLFGVLNKAMTSIGPKHFRAITSDNTGNTSVARQLVRSTYPWMIILPDPCHRLNLLCKDIGGLDHFTETIKSLRRIVKFFRKSTYAAALLKIKWAELGITRGIKSFGKTRFGTVYFSALSVEENFYAIADVCQHHGIEIPTVNHLFENGSLSGSHFLLGLRELTTVLGPIAKSITCLESSHSTVADVYLFWLAVAAETHRLITQNGLSNKVKEGIRHAVNYRFNQMVNGAPSDIFLTGFILDPRFHNANVLQDLNPLTLTKIRIPARDGKSTSMSNEQNIPETLKRVGLFLKGMLRTQYKDLEEPISGISIAEAVQLLKQQLIMYQKAIYPFDATLKKNDHAKSWWNLLEKVHGNEVQPLAKLAGTLFDLLPNSMADERTASTFKWLNSYLRNRQHVGTLVRTTTIRQWHLYHSQKKGVPFRPTVRFRDVKETIFGRKGTDTKGTRRTQDDDSSMKEGLGESNDEMDDDDDDDGNDEGTFEKEDEEDTSGMGTNNLLPDTFSLDQHINLQSPILFDILSDSEPTRMEKEVDSVIQLTAKNAFAGPSVDLNNDADWNSF